MRHSQASQPTIVSQATRPVLPSFWEDAEEGFAICGLCTVARDRLAPANEDRPSPSTALSCDDFARLLDAP